MPGFSVGKAENKLGIRASSTCPLNLDQVKVHSCPCTVNAVMNSCHGLFIVIHSYMSCMILLLVSIKFTLFPLRMTLAVL